MTQSEIVSRYKQWSAPPAAARNRLWLCKPLALLDALFADTLLNTLGVRHEWQGASRSRDAAWRSTWGSMHVAMMHDLSIGCL